MRTSTLVVSCEIWLRPPAPSTIWVLVGLPLTTKVPDRPAPTLASVRPTRSLFSLKRSLYLAAYALDVAALWARMTRKQEKAMGISVATSPHVTSWGKPKVGRPLGTVPSVEIPLAVKLKK